MTVPAKLLNLLLARFKKYIPVIYFQEDFIKYRKCHKETGDSIKNRIGVEWKRQSEMFVEHEFYHTGLQSKQKKNNNSN